MNYRKALYEVEKELISCRTEIQAVKDELSIIVSLINEICLKYEITNEDLNYMLLNEEYLIKGDFEPNIFHRMFFKNKIRFNTTNNLLTNEKLHLDKLRENLRKANDIKFNLDLKISQRNESFSNNPEIISYPESVELETIGYSKPLTTGESEYYKELLKDERWKKKSKYVRDIYSGKCYNCNCIKLNKIEDIKDWIADSELYGAVLETFNNKEVLIKNITEINNYWIFKIKHKWCNDKEEVFLYSLESKEIHPFFRTNRIEYLGISIDDFSTDKEIKVYHFEHYNTKNSFLVIHKNFSYTRKDLVYRYFDSFNTNSSIYLHFRNHYSGSFAKAQGVIFIEGFEIVFPVKFDDKIAKDNDTIEVHHIKYRMSGLPWESSCDELVTLCSDCHKSVHAKINKNDSPKTT